MRCRGDRRVPAGAPGSRLGVQTAQRMLPSLLPVPGKSPGPKPHPRRKPRGCCRVGASRTAMRSCGEAESGRALWSWSGGAEDRGDAPSPGSDGKGSPRFATESGATADTGREGPNRGPQDTSLGHSRQVQGTPRLRGQLRCPQPSETSGSFSSASSREAPDFHLPEIPQLLHSLPALQSWGIPDKPPPLQNPRCHRDAPAAPGCSALPGPQEHRRPRYPPAPASPAPGGPGTARRPPRLTRFLTSAESP